MSCGSQILIFYAVGLQIRQNICLVFSHRKYVICNQIQLTSVFVFHIVDLHMATNSVIILQGYCSVGFARVVEQSEKSDSIEYKDLRSEIHTSYII